MMDRDSPDRKLPVRELPDGKLRQDNGRLRRAGDSAPNANIHSPEIASIPLPAPGFAFPSGSGLF
jgi:hypothetical protein